MENPRPTVKSVAVIGAGAAGAITAAALTAENFFDHIRVFERREIPGGTWIHDLHPDTAMIVEPGKLPPASDPPLPIPTNLPAVMPPNKQNRWALTPIYNSLTTNVPHVAMCFSDALFPYGPFAPHCIARQYIENYFSIHGTDRILEVNTTVEDLSRVIEMGQKQESKWKLTLRKYDPTRLVDVWWEETFDAVVLANGHYSVPYIPAVQGLSTYITNYPNRVSHSKTYRSPQLYRGKKIIVVGNSASGHDISIELASVAQQPVYLSRRSKARWEGDEPPAGVVWKPTIKDFKEDGAVAFSDDTSLENVDAVIYCTGYKTSFPFWNEKANGGSLWDYSEDRLVGTYLHTFFQDFPTLGIVGLPRTLTFRSFEYQAIALARLWSNRNTLALPPPRLQKIWETEYAKKQRGRRQKFHDIPWENNETKEYLDLLFQIAGLGTIDGDGRIPPPLTKEMVWALEHIQKYPSSSSKAPNKAPEWKETDTTMDSWLLL